MRKGKSVIGKDVLSLADGVRVETVSDVVIDPDGLRVVALVVDEGGFLSSSKVVPSDQVESYGKDAVVIPSRQSVVSVGDHAELRSLVDREERLLGRHVFTVAGDKLGSISDVYFDEGTGSIVGYEVSSGKLGDVAKGASYLATDEITNVGQDVIYVQPETAGSLESQVGGVQGALQGAGDRIGEAGRAAGEKVGAASDGATQRMGDARPEERLIGKRTGSDIEDENGSVVIPAGRRLRPGDVALARERGLLRTLSSSVALGESQAASEDAKDALGAAGDRAGSLWDQFTRKLSEVTDSTGARIDEQRVRNQLAAIEDALGRPVTKVILDRQDNVILNLGDIITHQAIQRAHDAGGLDSLLGSVYKGSVEFSKNEMRAPLESAASVEKSSGGAVLVEDLERQIDEAEQARRVDQERKMAQAEADRERRDREREARRVERDDAKRSRQQADQPLPPAGPNDRTQGIPVRRQGSPKT